jgi:hypothetical protein
LVIRLVRQIDIRGELDAIAHRDHIGGLGMNEKRGGEQKDKQSDVPTFKDSHDSLHKKTESFGSRILSHSWKFCGLHFHVPFLFRARLIFSFEYWLGGVMA